MVECAQVSDRHFGDVSKDHVYSSTEKEKLVNVRLGMMCVLVGGSVGAAKNVSVQLWADSGTYSAVSASLIASLPARLPSVSETIDESSPGSISQA